MGLITHKEFAAWHRKKWFLKGDNKQTQKRLALLLRVEGQTVWQLLHKPEKFDKSGARPLVDILVKVTGAYEHRREQVGEMW